MITAQLPEEDGGLALPVLSALATDGALEPVGQHSYALRIMPDSISELCPICCRAPILWVQTPHDVCTGRDCRWEMRELHKQQVIEVFANQSEALI